MKIAIVDDVSADRAQLIKYVEQYAKDNAVDIGVSEYESGEAFLAGTSLTEVDVIFLDIYLSGMSGMDLAYKIRSSNQPCNIVFVTTTSSFAVQSYDVQAFYYILKPYVYKDFSNVMSKLMQKMQKSPEYIKVKEGRDWCKILLEDI
ncbi:MAG: response regulator, partial [Oscillospiraceae bacterium]